MPQHRLEHYFTPTRPRLIPSGRSFLDLPGHVRKLIYEYADLHDSFIDLNYSNLKAYAPGTYPDTRDCLKLSAQEDWAELRKLDVIDPEDIWEFCDDFDPGVYENSVFNRSYGLKQSLLLASREVHKEVEALIYSGLTFRVCLGQPLGFKRLWRMSDAALLNMQSLTIRLDVPKTKVESHGWSDYIRPPAYIDVSLKWGKSILKEWTSILKRLGQFVRPGQLKLRVIFCAKTMEDATAIIKPMSQLPLLKDCGICADLYGQDSWWEPKRYCYNNIELYESPRAPHIPTELSYLVQKTIQKLTGPLPTDPTPFRYSDLPQELRLAILEYTDLVSSDVVQWRPRRMLILDTNCECCTVYGPHAMTNDNHCFCTSSRPNTYLKTIDNFRSYPCCEYCRPEDHSGICYCSDRGPIWCSSCKCVVPYHPLFSVSAQVRQDATRVYYAHYQFLITPYNNAKVRLAPFHSDSSIVSGSFHMPKVELSLYLSSISRNALQHIRRLEWILPDSKPNYLLPKSPGWHDYLDTILLMQNAMTLSALTFTMNLSAMQQRRHAYYTGYSPLEKSSWRWYEMIILPMRQLGEAGLKDFFVYLSWAGIERGMRIHHEKDLERAVMGKDYDSVRRGKPTERMYKTLMERRAAEGWEGY